MAFLETKERQNINFEEGCDSGDEEVETELKFIKETKWMILMKVYTGFEGKEWQTQCFIFCFKELHR